MKLIHHSPKKPMPWLSGKDAAWKEFWRVRLPDARFATQKRLWCRTNIPSEDWGCSEGAEAFYFRDLDHATLFKLQWEGAE